MAVHRTHKLLSSEKRLQLVQTQLYGKDRENSVQKNPALQKVSIPTSLTHRPSDNPSNSESFQSDITYLKHDLTKITILASVAIGVQILIKIFFERG